MAETKHLIPGLFWRLLGFKGGSIDISEKGVTLHKSDKSYFIDNHSFVKKGIVERGLLGSKLIFNTTKGKIPFGPLPHSEVKQAYEWLQSYWYKEIFPEINTTFKQLQKRLTSRYIRSSQWPDIVSDAQSALNRFVEPPNEDIVDADTKHPFDRIYHYAHMGKKDLKKYRDKYIETKKRGFKKYFENIEAHPLTKDQIEACIIDEDNNLVLAGAGTGKTSTMVGRAGFLLESKQAKPESILMLAFTKEASKEMQERMQQRINRDDVSISTFHKLGINIISKVEGGKPSRSKYAEDNKSKSSVFKQDVSKWIDELLEENSYKDKVIKYFEDYLFVEKSPFDFKTQGEYFTYIEADEIRTFKGEKVKGHGERIVANFLLKMGIEYEYEATYQPNTKTIEYGPYKPDFYLPEHNVYIEHQGIDKDGSTAPYIDRDLYNKKIEWNHNIHKANKTILVETFYYEHKDGTLRSNLTKKLNDLGIESNPLPNDAIIETLREHEEITRFSDLMAEIIKRYKANWFDQDKLNSKINASPYKKHLNIALELMMPLMNRYEKILRDNDELDFEDMIGKALEYVLDGSFKPKWKYIMVDEFQDISDPRARLVQALKEKSNNCSLFCVGDDWQAIYRFSGSDISFTTGFSEYFGATQFTKLKKTFRFNNSIAEVSSQFVLKNPFQTKKSITTHSKVKKSAVSLLRESNKIVAGDDKELNVLLRKLTKQPDNNNSPYLLGRYMQVDKVLQAINKLDRKVSVLILGRYQYTIPSPAEMKLHKEKFPNLELNKHTVHASKGKEADYVIVMRLQSGKDGFPSEKTNNPLLDALLPTPEDFEFAEERRLFYVAITRAKKRSYLIADMSTSSSFVNELINKDYDIELNEFEIAQEQRIFQKFHCIKCETGVMQHKVRRTDNATFYGCSHWSLCKHTENECSHCGGAMTRVNESNKYRVCLPCKNWVLVCPDCGDDMKCFSGRYGLFWRGLRSHSDDKTTCQYTVNNNKVIPPKGYPNIEQLMGKKFSSYKDAKQYAEKVTTEPKKTTHLVENEFDFEVFSNWADASEYAKGKPGKRSVERLDKGRGFTVKEKK